MKSFLVIIGFVVVFMMLSHISDDLEALQEGLAAHVIADIER